MRKVLVVDSPHVKCMDNRILPYLFMMKLCRNDTLKSLECIGNAIFQFRREENESSIGDLIYHATFVEVDWLSTDVLGKDLPGEMMNLLPYEDRDAKGHLMHIPG